MKNLSLKIAALCAAAGLMFSAAQAQTVDATFVGGSTIRTDARGNNYSTGGLLTVGQDPSLPNGGILRGVMQFSLADIVIPQGARVESVKLVLGIATNDANSVAADLNVELFALTQAFTPSQVTWNSAATGTTWTTGGGVFGSTPLDTLAINSKSATGTHEFASIDLTALIQQSLDNGDDLVNLLLKLNNESNLTREVLRFGLRNGNDGNVPTFTPRLEIVFVPEPSTVALMLAVPVIGLVLLRRRNRR